MPKPKLMPRRSEFKVGQTVRFSRFASEDIWSTFGYRGKRNFVVQAVKFEGEGEAKKQKVFLMGYDAWWDADLLHPSTK
jgi:hypothetical protein